jgi:D-alanyl-D-alanine carboxypeptidase
MTPDRGTPSFARRLAASLRFLLSIFLVLAGAACDRDPSGPRIAGFDDDELQRILDDAVTTLGIPGAVVSITSARGDRWVGASGVSDLIQQTPMDTANLLRIGSITKTFVGIITLQLADEGKLSLDDPLQKWLPGIVPAADSVTIRMLMNHTSGIPNYLKADTFQQALIANRGQSWTPDSLVAIAASMPRTPMGIWDYSNTNFTLLGMIIEKATGSTFQAQLQTRIIGRLGLTRTSFATDAATPPGLTSGYCDWGSSVNYQVGGLNASIAGTAGAMISSIGDVTRWAQALASGELISPKMFQEQMTTVPTYPGAPTARYGLAIVVSDGWVGHKGEIFGFNSVMYAKKDVGTIVVITNKSPNTQEAAPDIFRAFSGRLFNSYPLVNLAPFPGPAMSAPADGPRTAVSPVPLDLCTTSQGI